MARLEDALASLESDVHGMDTRLIRVEAKLDGLRCEEHHGDLRTLSREVVALKTKWALLIAIILFVVATGGNVLGGWLSKKITPDTTPTPVTATAHN